MISRINNNRSFSPPIEGSGPDREPVANRQTKSTSFPQRSGQEKSLTNTEANQETTSKSSREKSITRMKADLLQQTLMDQLPEGNARWFKGEIIGVEPLQDPQAQGVNKLPNEYLPEVDDEVLAAKQPAPEQQTQVESHNQHNQTDLEF